MTPKLDVAYFNDISRGHLPEHLGIVVLEVGDGLLRAELSVRSILLAPNGYLHAGTVVSLADTCAGYGCIANLPQGATGFTTIELKCNHLSTAREGVIEGVGRLAHSGRTTQVWDVVVSARETGKQVALFRCTQLLLYPK
ncbi:MAG TPA: PaaI family thioesterase [Polyangiaceae bacterium]|nr:PaaI family thioesterase [Polyangiaceae bacterium]